MATSSSSSFAVDLGEAADLDDATSKLFFSDSSAALPGLSWSAASEIKSTLTTQDSLVALCSKHGVPSELTPVCANHLGWRACTPPPTVGSNRMCVFSAALDAGLRFPLHAFYGKVLRHYQLAQSQLTPNSWSYLAAFVLLCEDAGVDPMVSAFRYFFTICAHKQQGKPTGYHHFQPFPDRNRRLFTGGSSLPSWSGWRSRFFFLDCPSGWKCPVKWGKPTRKDTRRVQLTDTVIEKLKQMRCVDVKDFLANREMPVGDQAALAPLQSAVKAEAGAAEASAATIGATAESASTRKRSRLSPPAVLSQPQTLPMSPIPGLAPITTRASSNGGRSVQFPPPQQQSLGEFTSAPREVPGMRARAQAVSIGGSSGEVTPPAMCATDALQMWEAVAKTSEQAATIAKLNQELHLVEVWNAQWHNELRAAGAEHAELVARLHAANDRNNHLNEQLVRLDEAYVADRDKLIGHLRTASAEVVRLQAASVEVAQLKAEHAAERAQLKEELAAEAKRLKHEGYTMGARDMRDLALTMHKGDISPDELKVELLLDYGYQGASPVAVEDQ